MSKIKLKQQVLGETKEEIKKVILKLCEQEKTECNKNIS